MDDTLLEMTRDIVLAQITASPMPASEVPDLISSVYAAIVRTTEPGAGSSEEPETKPEPAVTVRKSLASKEHIISMIDGRPYKTLKRHIGTHGFTPESYRETFNLPADYPMVAPAYSEARSTMAKNIGLGNQAGKRRTGGRRKKA